MERTPLQKIPPNPLPPYYEEDEITLKELILKIQEFWRELWKNKWWLILSAALIASIFSIKTLLDDTTYTSSLTFLLSGNDNKSGDELSAILGLTAINYELDKVVELARSRRIINNVLLKEEEVDGKVNYLANHIINIYNLHEKWKKEAESNVFKDLQLVNFYFTHKRIKDFLPREHRALNLVNELVAGNNFKNKEGLMDATYNNKTEIVRLSVKPINEDLSLRLIDAIYEELSHFYEQETVGRPRRMHQILTTKVDSIYEALGSQESKLARESDRYGSIASKLSSLKLGQLERKVETTNRHYQEVLKNKERVELILNSETPEFQIIDRTFIPIMDAPSIFKAILIGGFLGGFLGAGYIIGRKVVRDAMME